MELFKLFGTIALENKQANEGIDETTEKAEDSQSRIGTAFENIGNAAVKAGQVIAAGLAAGSAAIIGLAKGSLDSYAEYEQLVGGVQTLFGVGGKSLEDYAKEAGKTTDEVLDEWLQLTTGERKILNNAEIAFQTAGLSANEYMNTVTSFSASLIQSLGGDTSLAADLADQAIIDMSDNANKMGTDISAIQNAYQGFAKQNYTMLDNLKLGYGGTATEMARLINDSGILGDKLIDLTDTKGIGEAINEVGFAGIVEAIHAIQEQMGILGTTEREASTTIQGSLLATKAAWQNLMTGFADDSASLDLLIEDLVTSATTAAQNIVPRIAQILAGISTALAQIMPVISEQLPSILSLLLPGIISGAVALFNGLVVALPELLQILISQMPFIMTEVGNGLLAAFPVLLSTVKQLFGQIWDYIAVELLGTEANFESSFEEIRGIFNDVWSALQFVWDTVGQPIFDAIQSVMKIAYDAFAQKWPVMREFAVGCFKDIQTIWNTNLKPCLEAIGNFIETVLAPAFQYVFGQIIGPVIDTCFGFIKSLWEDTLKPVFTGITDFLTGVFTGNWEKAFNGLVNIAGGIFNGLVNKIKTPINLVIDVINGFISGLNKLKIPDWVPAVGGKGINIPLIPKLAEGGILEKGQVGLLEGSGAEAVVPLDQNSAWIAAVAKDMQGAIGGSGATRVLELILEALKTLDASLVEKMTEALEDMKFDINNREFARLVKAVG